MATVRSATPASLTIVPRGALSTTEQLDALRRDDAQADLRMKIGVQLVKAAEAQATQQHSILTQVKAQQDVLRQELQADFAASLNHYDHQITRIDDQFTQRLAGLEDRIDGLARQWEQSRRKIDVLLNRADDLLEDGDNPLACTDAVAGPSADPHAGATVAPPAVPEPAPESAAHGEGIDLTPQQEIMEPALRFTDVVDKLNLPHASSEGPRPA